MEKPKYRNYTISPVASVTKKILVACIESPKTVKDLMAITGYSSTGVRKHLSALRQTPDNLVYISGRIPPTDCKGSPDYLYSFGFRQRNVRFDYVTSAERSKRYRIKKILAEFEASKETNHE